MKRNLSQLLQTPPSGGHSKEAFDLHNYEYFHQKGAQLNVASIRSVAPGCDYELSVDAVTRSNLCNTANFADIKENWYILFVPNFLVSNNAYQMLVQRRQDYSAIRSNIEQFPVFDLKAVVKRCLEIGMQDQNGLIDPITYPEWYDIHGFCIAPGALRLLDMLKYGCYIDLYEWICSAANVDQSEARYNAVSSYLDTRLDGIYPSVQSVGAYQCCWYNYFRNPIYDVAGDASCYNFDDVVLHADGVTPAFEVTAVRGVDSFIQNCLKLHYVQNKKDMFMGSMPGTQFGACASVPMSSDLSFVFSGVTSTDKDWMQTSDTVNLVNGDVNNLWIDIGGQKMRRTQDATKSRLVTHDHSLAATVNVQSGYSLFDVLTLVQSQAMQKWRQKSMLAGNKTVDQFRAHHGEVPRHLVDHLPDFIGSVDNYIKVSEITSTANTLDVEDGMNNLGEIRGRGYGASDMKKFHFHSSDYGTVILLHSIVTENVYSSFGLSYDNRLIYYSDFFQQEFQNIGLEAVPKFLLDTLSRDAFGPITDPHPDASLSQFLQGQMVNLYGMYVKYYGYKESVDQVHGLFNPSRIGVEGEVGPDPDNPNKFGYADMQSFVVPRADMVAGLTYTYDAEQTTYAIIDGYNLFNLSRIYQNPRLFNSIFGVNYDDHFDTDNFFTKCRFNVDALLPMTKLGLPDF